MVHSSEKQPQRADHLSALQAMKVSHFRSVMMGILWFFAKFDLEHPKAGQSHFTTTPRLKKEFNMYFIKSPRNTHLDNWETEKSTCGTHFLEVIDYTNHFPQDPCDWYIYQPFTIKFQSHGSHQNGSWSAHDVGQAGLAERAVDGLDAASEAQQRARCVEEMKECAQSLRKPRTLVTSRFLDFFLAEMEDFCRDDRCGLFFSLLVVVDRWLLFVVVFIVQPFWN